MTMRRMLRTLAICVVTIVVAGCQSLDGPGVGNGNGNGNGDGNGDGNGNGGTENEVVPGTWGLVADGFTQPVGIAFAGDGRDRLFVAEKAGTVRAVVDGAVRVAPFLDLSARTASIGERGLLAMAFHPDFATNGRLFVHFTDEAASPPGDSVVAEVTVDPPGADTADVITLREIIRIEGPGAFHHGGQLAFGPDGFLYIAVGDRGDPAASQELTTLTGTILRLDVDSAATYDVPADNPFVGVAGAQPEIWAYGLRNPWRISFDTDTGDLWIADVGEVGAEEVNLQPSDSPGGENYGWPVMEGDACHDPPVGCVTAGLTLPTLTYPWDDPEFGRSVTGGYVYRGGTFGGLVGSYVFGDFISGRVFVAEFDDVDGWTMRTLFETDAMIVTFGRDEAGELYFADFVGGAVYGFAE